MQADDDQIPFEGEAAAPAASPAVVPAVAEIVPLAPVEAAAPAAPPPAVAPPAAPVTVEDLPPAPPRNGGRYSFDPATGRYTELT